MLRIERLDTDTQRALVQNSIRTNALRDPRTGECVVRVTEDGIVPNRVFVDLEVTPLRSEVFTERTGFALEL